MVDQSGKPWSDDEVSATVQSYFKMLKLERAGQQYNKAEHNRLLRNHLAGRSKGAVEFKHQNISAILMGLGWIPISGYKPMKNFQQSLAALVAQELQQDSQLDQIMTESLDSEDDFQHQSERRLISSWRRNSFSISVSGFHARWG